MGCGISKGDLKAVEEVTGMSESDVKEAYKGFKQENKADKINLAKFTKLVSSMNTNKGTLSYSQEVYCYKNESERKEK